MSRFEGFILNYSHQKYCMQAHQQAHSPGPASRRWWRCSHSLLTEVTQHPTVSAACVTSGEVETTASSLF